LFLSWKAFMNDATRLNLCLDGAWRLVLDPEDLGRKQEWFRGESLPAPIGVRVPSVWDLWIPDYDGVGWYFREFELDAEWEERCVELRFEAVDYYAEVWLNGVRLGDHEGGYTPFSFEATGTACGGLNRVAVRVIDPHGPEGFGDFRPKEIPSSKEGGYWSFAGIWGSVSLIGKPHAHLKDVFIEPDIRRKRIGVTVTASHPYPLHLWIEGTPYETSSASGKSTLNFPEFELWSPDGPNLYTLRCELLEG